MRSQLAILLLLLVSNPRAVLGQADPEQETVSCCAGALASCPVCRSRESEALPPLPEDASSKERWLRKIGDESLTGRNLFLSTRMAEEFRARLGSLSSSADFNTQVSLRWSLALFLLRIGDVKGSIELYEQCVEMIESNEKTPASWLPEALYRLAIAYFRLAERQNCIARHNSESCIFPLSAAAVHVDKNGAEMARATLERLLALEASDLDGEARWTLNIVHMALGTYPDAVPKEHLIPPSRFASESSVQRFRDVAPELGIDRYTRAGSVVMDDFDGDGDLDLVTSTFDPSRSLRFFRNRGDGGFEDATAEAGLSHQLGGLNLVQGDVDGDGRLDVFVLRGGTLGSDGEMPCSLLRQSKPGVFEDVTSRAGIEIAAPTRTACFADIDKDGDLDLFVGYESEGQEGNPGARYPSHLYRNEGKAVFTDITLAAGIKSRGPCAGAVFGDVDGDGFPDLYLSHRDAPNSLYRNQGDGTFVDVASELNVTEPRYSNGCWFFDYDNDGDLDLFVSYYLHHWATRAVEAFYRNGAIDTETSRLYENDGKGGYGDVTADRRLHRVSFATGANFGDVDGDGYQDIYLGTGGHEMSDLWPNVLLRNDHGRSFQDATQSAGVGHLQKGQGIAFGDVDNDGDEDLFLQVGGFFQDDGFGDVLFENPGHGNRWLCVELEGTTSNRFGIGSRIRVTVQEEGGARDIYSHVGANGTFGSSSLRSEMGLGRAEAIVELEVLWPATGERQQFRDVPLDRAVRVKEGASDLRILDRTRFRLGSRRRSL